MPLLPASSHQDEIPLHDDVLTALLEPPEMTLHAMAAERRWRMERTEFVSRMDTRHRGGELGGDDDGR